MIPGFLRWCRIWSIHSRDLWVLGRVDVQLPMLQDGHKVKDCTFDKTQCVYLTGGAIFDYLIALIYILKCIS